MADRRHSLGISSCLSARDAAFQPDCLGENPRVRQVASKDVQIADNQRSDFRCSFPPDTDY